ncbi:MAG: hypothetical protein AAF376_18820 [Pseudomonadota bacterium]
METWIFLAGLFLVTMGVFLVASMISKRRTEKRLHDDSAPKSSLAKDGPGPNPVTAPRGADVTPDGNNVTPQGQRTVS